MSKNRWIMYASIVMPGNQSSKLTCHESLEWCKKSLESFSEQCGMDTVYATLYAYSDDAWLSAREYEDIGIPFDCPDRIIERGPKGGLVVKNT